MDKHYYAAGEPDSYGSALGLKRRSGQSYHSVRDYLSRQDAYTLHKDVRRRFPRRNTLALSIDELWQIDLVDLSSLSRSNDGYRYLLTCIDVLSKFGRVVAIKNKSAAEVTAAFAQMIRGTKCQLLQSDKGSEFLNSTFQKLLFNSGITHYTSENDDIKCAVVERWHRTLLAKLYRYFTQHNTTRYVDVIQDIVKSYNSTIHSSIKMAPKDVSDHNESQVRARLLHPVNTRARFKVDDVVRISGAKRAFSKGYRDKWSEEIFTVTKVYDTIPVTFGLKDSAGDAIKGKFYNDELQKVIKEVFRIEKVLRTRKRAGKTEYYVKWLGYPDKFNSWTDHISV
jgi:transposase InsO family protein